MLASNGAFPSRFRTAQQQHPLMIRSPQLDPPVEAPSRRYRLYVIHKLPTPYNDDFFKALHADPQLDLQVYHLWRGSERRPWKSQLATGYPNYFMRPVLGLDFPSLRQAWNDKRSLFMVGDWAHPPTIALILTRLLRRAPVALWADTPQEHLPRPFFKRIPRKLFLRWLLSRVNATFGSGRPAFRALLSMGAPATSIVDLQFMVDLERPKSASTRPEVRATAQALRRRVGCENTGVVFLMSGTIDFAKKAQDLGLSAFAQCKARTPVPIGLLIAGAGPDQEQLRQQIEDLGLSGAVAMLGWQEPDDMDAVYQACDVLLHPAHYDPFPLVVIEALSWGRAVIGTATSGSVEERVVDGESGYSVPPGDVAALTAAMEKLSRDELLLIKLKAHARQAAEAWPLSRGVAIVREVAERTAGARVVTP